jgi:acyl carrier protein
MTFEARLDAIFEDLMPYEAVPLRERSRNNSMAWDSLCQLSLIIAIEQEFDVALADGDVIELTSYSTALALIHDLKGPDSQ